MSHDQHSDQPSAKGAALELTGSQAGDHHRVFSTPADQAEKSSRLPGFYELPVSERQLIVQRIAELTADELASLRQALATHLTDVFIENSVGGFDLPLGIATNFRINDHDVLVPMAVEETSVVAAASHGAKLARAGGGFRTTSSEPIMTGQIQLKTAASHDFERVLTEHRTALLAYANRGQERLCARGGGAVDLSWRYLDEIESLVLHVHVNTCDAMGANIVNTMCEKLADLLPELFPGTIGLRILTNLTDRRTSTAQCLVPAKAFSRPNVDGRDVVSSIVAAYEFAEADVYRATTNNKGVMNGIDPVVIATGNDWRAIEAGAHAYVCRDGRYRPMAKWRQNKDGDLEGELTLPMAVGTVGGVTKLHPKAKVALKILGSPHAQRLGEIICSVGLAQNLSALRALASEGIQRGHMSLHQRNLDLLQRPEARAGASRADHNPTKDAPKSPTTPKDPRP